MLETDQRDRPAFRRLRPGPGQSRTDVLISQRERLQRALIELAAGDGYGSVTVRRLTKLAKVSTSSFYAHFDGTDDCLASTYGQLMGNARERIEATRAPGEARLEQCGHSIATFLASLAESPPAARLTLFEIFGAGPAAVDSAQCRETELENALRQSMDRRGSRVEPSAVTWVTAGLLHCMRSELDAHGEVRPSTVEEMIGWGQACLADLPAGLRVGRWTLDGPTVGRGTGRSVSADSPGNETELILSAIMRLARRAGYHGISPAGASKAAGVPAARFKRYFSDPAEAYLAGVTRAADDLFAGFRSRSGVSSQAWPKVLCGQVAALSEAAAADPDLASLVFSGILAPGLGGLTRREALLHEIATTWRSALPPALRPDALVAEASMAALWGSISRSIELGHSSRLPRQAPTNAYLFLVPMVGSTKAEEIVSLEFGPSTREGAGEREARAGSGAAESRAQSRGPIDFLTKP